LDIIFIVFKKVITAIIILTLILVFFITIFPTLFLFVGLYASPNPPVPEITYGEFDIYLEYEVDGERFVVNDRMICEYDGVGMDTGRLKFRKWKRHLADSGGEYIEILTDGMRKVYCYVGRAEYYMNDETHPEIRPLTPRLIFVNTDKTDTTWFSQEELLDHYKIRIIDWEFQEPIVNSFGK
jgi:hypothetical protein